ncbi:MAG: hypothetical protein NXH95_17370 [Pseudomonadaceae bacterium]|nr:hypothetical protein [Pseudomonadaceae bacterium]
MDQRRMKLLALEHRVKNADDAAKVWINRATEAVDTLGAMALTLSQDENLSDTGRFTQIKEAREKLKASHVDPVINDIAARRANLQADREKVKPTAEPMDPMTKDRMIRAFQNMPPADRNRALASLKDEPELAQALAEESPLVTGITPDTRNMAAKLVMKSPDPKKLGKLDSQLRVLDDVESYVNTIAHEVVAQ